MADVFRAIAGILNSFSRTQLKKIGCRHKAALMPLIQPQPINCSPMGTLSRRKFTEEQKRSILAEAEKRGIMPVLREHRLSYSVFSRWKYQATATAKGDEPTQQQIQQQLKNLMLENERLKKIIANQALEIQIKTERINNAGFR